MADVSTLPKRRIKDIQSARATFTGLMRDDEQARSMRAIVRNQIEGGLPRDQAKLTKLGRGHEANHNFGGARGDFEKAMTPYFRMVWEMPRKASVTIHSRQPLTQQYQSAFESNFDRFVEDWEQDAIFQYLAMSQDHCAHGIGIVFFDEPKSPRWKAVNRGDLLVPRRTPLNSKSLPMCCIRQTLTVADLYEKITDEKAAARAGWNVAAVKAAITKVVRADGTGGVASRSTLPGDWERVQDQIRDNDAGTSATSESVPVVSMLVKEFGERVSCVQFTEESCGEGQDGYLYEEPEFAEKMEDVLKLVVFEVPLGERNLHGVRGFATKNYPHARIENRLLNKTLNLVDLSATLVFKGGKSITTYPMRRLGESVTVVDDSLEQVPIYPPVQAAVQMHEVLQQNKAEKLSLYRQQGPGSQRPETATGERIAANQETSLNQASAALYLKQFSGVYKEQMKRLRAKSSDPDAKAFRKRCVELEVPEAILDDAEVTIQTAASAGAAAPWAREEKFQKWNGLLGLPEVNRMWFLSSQAAQDFGPNNVDKALNLQSDPRRAAQGRAAMHENADLADGFPIPALPEDDHEAHIMTHVQPIIQVLQEFDGQDQNTGGAKPLDPGKVMATQMIGGHIEQHFQILEADKTKTEATKKLKAQWTAVEGRTRNLLRAVQNNQSQAPV